MSFYSDGNVQTMYVDPRTYIGATHTAPSGRITFELDGNNLAYLPNMRLLNVGCSSNGAHLYNRLTGAYALIRNIRLLDGKTELSALSELPIYKGFLNVNGKNSKNESVDSMLSQSSVGWSISGLDRKVNRIQKTVGATALAATTNLGWLDLREVFPILNAVSHLPTAVFKNLNIEIELNAGLDRQILTDAAAHISSIRPVLAVDMLMNPSIVNRLNAGMTSARWLEVEHDQFVIPAGNHSAPGSNNVLQELNIKLNGFNKKHVERLVIAKEFQNSLKAANGFQRYCSPACFRQEVQFRINGRNILPGNGLTGNNERLAYLVDTYGDFVSYPGSNVYAAATANIVENGADFLGQLDYIGCYFGQYIDDLQINYGRAQLQHGAGVNNPNATTDALNAHVFAEVAKNLVINGDSSYVIEYSQN